METHRLVMTEDLNQYGSLFGGRLLSWVDEASFIAASIEFPACRFVTIGMDKVEFRHGIKVGTIVVIRCNLKKLGTTSVTYHVEVFDGKLGDAEVLFDTRVSFVNINEAGKNVKISR